MLIPSVCRCSIRFTMPTACEFNCTSPYTKRWIMVTRTIEYRGRLYLNPREIAQTSDNPGSAFRQVGIAKLESICLAFDVPRK